MINVSDNNDYYKQFNLVTDTELNSLRSELYDSLTSINCRINSNNNIIVADNGNLWTSVETPTLYADTASIGNLINPQIEQLKREIETLKNRLLAIENKRQEEAEKDIVYIMGE